MFYVYFKQSECVKNFNKIFDISSNINRSIMIIYIYLMTLFTVYASGKEIKLLKNNDKPESFRQETIAVEVGTSTVHYKSASKFKPLCEHMNNQKYNNMEISIRPKKQFQIQYAPLPDTLQKTSGAKYSTKSVDNNVVKTENLPEEEFKKYDNTKTNVAPYVDVRRNNYRSIVPGYNIEVLQLSERNSIRGHDTVYKSNPEFIGTKNNYKVTNIEEDVSNNNSKRLPSQLPNKSSIGLNPLDVAANKKYELKANMMNTGTHQNVEKLRRSSIPLSAKIRRIHLNLARVYSPGQALQNLPLHEYDNDLTINIRPVKQRILPPSYPEIFEKKTELFRTVDEKDQDFHIHLQ